MKTKITVLLLIVIGIGAAVFAWPQNSHRRELSDGTVLVLSGVKVGRTNIYYDGNWLSLTVGRFVPRTGLRIGGFKIERPRQIVMTRFDGLEFLTAQIQLIPGSSDHKWFLASPINGNYRLQISDGSDFAFMQDFVNFQQRSNGNFALIQAIKFPRTTKQLRFRLEERDRQTPLNWHELTTWVVNNPNRTTPKPWVIKESPRLKFSTGEEIEVGDLIVRDDLDNSWTLPESRAFLAMRAWRHGEVISNWGIWDGKVEDASGNIEWFSYQKVITNDWRRYRLFRPLDPTLPWKFQIHYGADSDFAATNLFSLSLPSPSPGLLKTNLGGVAVNISLGDARQLYMSLPDAPPGLRLTIVRAVDDDGADLEPQLSPIEQHTVISPLKSSKSPHVNLTVAIHPDYEAEFILQPKFEKSPSARPNP